MANNNQNLENNNHMLKCIPLYKAAISGDWEAANRFFEEKKIALDVSLTLDEQTPLHVAVGTNRCHRFVEELVKRITRVGNPQMLRACNKNGDTPLHYAARVGNIVAVRLLVDNDPQLTQCINNRKNTALTSAAWWGRKEMVCYLLEVTKDVVGGPYRGKRGADLLTYAIAADFYDVALYLVKKNPDLVLEKDETALLELASKPSAFRSGSRLGPWQSIIYYLIPVNREKALQSERIPKYNQTKAALFKKLHDSKVKHIQATELVKQMCTIFIENGDHDKAWHALGKALPSAIKHGIQEFMEQCLELYPGLTWSGEGELFLLAAIRARQEKVYNLVYQMSEYKTYAALDINDGDNSLHLAGKLAPPHRLNTVTGAALQMQRELQWFKEVEKLVHPSYQEDLNKDNRTPRMVFTHEHKELLKDAKQWMKDTSSSATVVATLIVTIAFAAIFTAPGGNNDSGKPLFLDDGVFILFAISDAVALFSSSTSVLMFLSILNSRFAEEDFLYALPKRLTLGLISLFISLAATMVAFSATLSLMLRDKIQWIAAPVILLASVPITLFLLLQSPLLVELVRSTYGTGIFYKQNNLMLH